MTVIGCGWVHWCLSSRLYCGEIGGCIAAISGVYDKGKPAALSSLPYPPLPWSLALFLLLSLCFLNRELWDVDKFLDSQNNRGAGEKESVTVLCSNSLRHSVLRLMECNVTDGVKLA